MANRLNSLKTEQDLRPDYSKTVDSVVCDMTLLLRAKKTPSLHFTVVSDKSFGDI